MQEGGKLSKKLCSRNKYCQITGGGVNIQVIYENIHAKKRAPSVAEPRTICFRFGSNFYQVPAPTIPVAKKTVNIMGNHICFGKFVNLAINILFLCCSRGK
jgi:hypothetical protein